MKIKKSRDLSFNNKWVMPPNFQGTWLLKNNNEKPNQTHFISFYQALERAKGFILKKKVLIIIINYVASFFKLQEICVCESQKLLGVEITWNVQ